MRARGFTLLELMLAVIIGTVVVLAAFSISTFTTKQVGVYVERYDMYSQMDYALEKLAVVLPTAVRVQTPFVSSAQVMDNEPFEFVAENALYTVTPEVFTDDASYRLEIDSDGSLVLEKEFQGALERDVLVDGKYTPRIRLSIGSEPNFLFVNLVLNAKRKQLGGLPRSIAKVEGIRLWFADLVATR